MRGLWILWVGVGLLLLARAVEREGEMGVRLALGGGTARLLRQFALEADGLRVIPWTWDMGLDPKTGQAMRVSGGIRRATSKDAPYIPSIRVYSRCHRRRLVLTVRLEGKGLQFWKTPIWE